MLSGDIDCWTLLLTSSRHLYWLYSGRFVTDCLQGYWGRAGISLSRLYMIALLPGYFPALLLCEGVCVLRVRVVVCCVLGWGCMWLGRCFRGWVCMHRCLGVLAYRCVCALVQGCGHVGLHSVGRVICVSALHILFYTCIIDMFDCWTLNWLL